MIVDGIEYAGIRNIENALIGSPTATSCLVRNLTNGRLPQNFGAFPGAALAMYQAAKPENRKKVAAILVPAVFTAAFVGITEPIEFTILLASPALFYLVHVPLSGLGMVLAEACGVALQGFALVFMIPNLLQPQKMHAMALIWMIPLFFALYYFIFKWAIVKFNIKTPGREDEEDEINMVDEITELGSAIMAALGGKENIVEIDNCISRLRLILKDTSKVDEAALKSTGSLGLIKINEENIQVVYGAKVEKAAAELKRAVKANV